ncbi:MAG: acetyl-CoA carboxylase biotin carboxyl carrier protein [bacterium]
MADSKQPTEIETEINWIRALAEVLDDTGLSEVEIEKNDIKLRVAKGSGHFVAPTMTAAPIAQAPAPETPASTGAASAADHPGAVKSPMVGTAYMAPAPGADPFIKVGDKVREGQTLMIIEAMKTMNEIKAPHSGNIVEILAQDAEPVEFGEALLIIG